jgi:hypothetical protein
MGGIKLNIVNQNNRLKHGWIEVKSLSFILTQSSLMMELEGSLKRLRIADSTGYPNTFLTEDEYKEASDLMLLDTHADQDTALLNFNIKLLEQVNPGSKKIIIKVLIKDIIIDYFQQPVLRIIDYLLNQLLPSLSTDKDINLRKP